jgi:predicted GIY-YIG superfamily endonuclease
MSMLYKSYYVYIMTNESNTPYTGVTNDLTKRVFEHKNKLLPGFTAKYNITKLVYFGEASRKALGVRLVKRRAGKESLRRA